VNFEEPADAGEVVSLRVLCPSCAAERRRQKLAARAGAAPATNAAAKPVAKAAPAASPAAAANARPAASPAARPAARPSAPAAAPANNTRPAARPAASPAAAPNARPAARPAAPASTGARPAAGPARPRNPTPAPRSVEPARASRLPVRRQPGGGGGRSELIVEAGPRNQPLLDKTTKIGMVAALFLFLVAGVFFFFVKGQKTAEQQAFEARAEAQADFMKELRGFDVSTPDDAAKVEPLVNEKADLWRGTSLSTEVNSILAKAEGTLTKFADSQEFEKRVVDMEEKLKNAATLEAKDLAEIRRGLRNMEVTASQYGVEMENRVKALKAAASRAYVDKLVSDAETFIAQNPGQGRPALNKLALAEEELRTQLEDAFKAKDTATREALEPVYKKMIDQSDLLATETFTDAYVEGTEWRDLLSPAEASKWNASTSTGFSWKITDGVMLIKGPAPDAKGQATISIGDEEKWRDMVVELEFTLKAGAPNLFFRAPKALDNRVKSILLEPALEGDAGWQLNKKYQLRVTFIGSRFVAVCSDPEDFQTFEPPGSYSDSRRGAFAMAIPKGAELEISKLRIKVLR